MANWSQYAHLSPDDLLAEAQRILDALPDTADRRYRHILIELQQRYGTQMQAAAGKRAVSGLPTTMSDESTVEQSLARSLARSLAQSPQQAQISWQRNAASQAGALSGLTGSATAFNRTATEVLAQQEAYSRWLNQRLANASMPPLVKKDTP